ncbi:fibrobacter succinogenes major paralogous domain-containing protein [Flavobacteriales bacterium]|nr:fibrobacter succinogenes major paralogous domain-containing protein [Flavobacteriales bacterium]
MKKLLTILFAVALGLNLSAQTDYVETWDPDADGDGLIGVSDLLALLGVFQEEDMDNDGIWDSQDDCIGAYDECGECNGPGPQILGIDTIIVYYDSLYAEAIDEWWVFEVYSDTLLTYLCENPGCMDPTADNYDPYVVEDDGSCTYSGSGPFECGGDSTVTFDGYTYDLVVIGDQCWFAENLRTEHYSNGDPVLDGSSAEDWEAYYADSTAAQTIYGSNYSYMTVADSTNLAQTGRLYNWYAVNDERGLCPSGWHVPTDGEFMTLEMELGMSESDANAFDNRGTNQGEQMKSSAFDVPAWNGTNTSGFSGLHGGFRARYYSGQGNEIAYFWTSTKSTIDQSFTRYLYTGDSQVIREDQDFRIGLSVRCVRD